MAFQEEMVFKGTGILEKMLRTRSRRRESQARRKPHGNKVWRTSEKAVVKRLHSTDGWGPDDDVNVPVQEGGGHPWPSPGQFKEIRQKADCYGSS